MTESTGQQPIYPTRLSAGAALGRHLYQRARAPVVVWAVTPSGVEVAAASAEVLKCKFDVIVGSHLRLAESRVIGAMAEDTDAVIDPRFQPKFDEMEDLEQAIYRSRRAIKQERLLFRGQRPLREVSGMTVVIVDGQVTSPWKLLAGAQCAESMGAANILLAAAVTTQVVKEFIRARRVEFTSPTILVDPKGHPLPFGDSQNASADRLRSIVLARQAA